MAEIDALPWNGFTVASTFSGCGGSCLGYRMAGFKVVWANEFVPIAQQSYKANARPDCILDGRDIRKVHPDEIMKATGLKKGELGIFDGSPPCQAFSTAGKREKGWGTEKTYEHGAKQCNETLFDDYVRLLRGLMPKVFIAENVSGLVKGTAKGYFLEILAALKDSGYRVQCKLLDAQWLGVPQTRQRVIFMGVRNDLGIDPVYPKPLPYRYTVRDALPEIGIAVHDTGGTHSFGTTTDHPAPAVMAQRTSLFHELGGLKKTECSNRPSPTITATQCRMIVGNDAFKPKWGSLNQASPTIMSGGPHGGSGKIEIANQRRKFTIDEVKRICAFPDDFELIGSYAQQWARLGNSVPPVMMQAIATVVRDQILLKSR